MLKLSMLHGVPREGLDWAQDWGTGNLLHRQTRLVMERPLENYPEISTIGGIDIIAVIYQRIEVYGKDL